LVLTDGYYPGWTVTVDGAAKKLLRANYFFRAVELPAGSHAVEFVYAPASFKLGALISALTALLLLTGTVMSSVRHQRHLPAKSSLVGDLSRPTRFGTRDK
jgi:uncharacterized membrane protein YfhO